MGMMRRALLRPRYSCDCAPAEQQAIPTLPLISPASPGIFRQGIDMLLIILIGAYLTYERPASALMSEVGDPDPSGRGPTLDERPRQGRLSIR